MSQSSLMYYNEVWGKGAPRVLRLTWHITAAVTVSSRPLAAAPGVLVTFGAISAQSTIDNFLGTTSEFDYLAFDATAMGADTMGVIVNMKGQAADLISVEAACYSGSGLATSVFRHAQKSTALTASTLATEAALGSSGNVAFRIDWGNTPDFDGLTSGTIIADINWIAK
jgi:hypothetical protein